MKNELNIDVATLDDPHRRALEEVIGQEPAGNQRLIISVMDGPTPQAGVTRPAQTLKGWTQIYDGLSDVEIEGVDKLAKTRANLTRKLP